MKTEITDERLSQFVEDLKQWEKAAGEAIDEWIKLNDLFLKMGMTQESRERALKRYGQKINNLDQARRNIDDLISNLIAMRDQT